MTKIPNRYLVQEVTRDGNAQTRSVCDTLITAQASLDTYVDTHRRSHSPHLRSAWIITDRENPERGDLSTADPILEDERETSCS